jgi:hypothetical protein
MEQAYTSAPLVITNAVAVFVVISAMLWPTISRILLSAIFIGAFALNLFTAIVNPSAYLEFGEFSTSDFYRSIILGPFSSHVTIYVSLIAICQLLIGVFISYKGNLMKIAMTGGIIFLLAISPLGYGAAFPAPLIMSLGLIILLSKRIRFNIYEIMYNKTNYSNS